LNNRFERLTILKAPTFGGGCLLFGCLLHGLYRLFQQPRQRAAWNSAVRREAEQQRACCKLYEEVVTKYPGTPNAKIAQDR